MPRRLFVTVMPAYWAPGTDSAAPVISPLSSAGVSNDARWCRSATNWVACKYIAVCESSDSSSVLGVFTMRASRSSVVGSQRIWLAADTDESVAGCRYHYPRSRLHYKLNYSHCEVDARVWHDEKSGYTTIGAPSCCRSEPTKE